MGGQGCSCFGASGTLPHLQEGERGGQYSTNMWHVFLIQFITSAAIICRTWPTAVTEILGFRPWVGWSKVSILADQDICSSPLCQDKPEDPPVHWELGTYSGGKAIGVRLTTHLHLVPSLRMSQFVLPPTLYDLMAFTYKDNITFVCFISKHK